jgi:hypothetical protein
MFAGFSRAVSRILFILKTRRIYGYNSVCERIFRYFFRSGTARRPEGDPRRDTTMERV